MRPEPTPDPVTRHPRPDGAHPHPHPHDHHVLVEPAEDRWRWRRRIRQNPHQLRVYRVAVAIAGLFFVALGFVSGPLPGPGGIPLVLLGLAVWASEFEWANRLMHWFKAQLARFRSWSRPRQVLAWLVFFAVCGLCGYGYLLTIGPPSWLPASVDDVLARLPGV
ncbi:MAG: hypothetical protein JWP61_469 [Friedmanniella sp.]|nr:hypothetical protein [Friedmanniella sp.]